MHDFITDVFNFPTISRGVFTGGAPFYASSGDADEMCEGAMWLYKATKEQSYLIDAKGYVDLGVAWSLGWDDKKVACQGKIMEEDTGVILIQEKKRRRESKRERESIRRN